VAGLCYISVGSMHINYYNEHDRWKKSEVAGEAYVALAKTNGVLAILNGFVWLVDGGYCIDQAAKD